MNAVSTSPVPSGVAKVIALHDDEITKKACGSIAFWSLSKEPITLPRLVEALLKEGSPATPPESPSALVALHRAMQVTSKTLKLDLHGRERGKWALVGKASTELSPDGSSKLAYPVEATAELSDAGTLISTGGDRFQLLLQQEFDAAKSQISSQDIGAWLCRKLSALDAVALRPSGGFYFLPQPVVFKWEKIVRALKQCSKHCIYSIPALKSSDAVEAILAAITSDTQQACDKISAEIPTVGKRALESRQVETTALLERAAKYEELLGMQLTGLRKAVEETRCAVAAAMLTAGNSDEEP